jgi:hypothetical protein
MTYRINKTDGSLLTEIIDSGIDTTATDLTLIGKNVTGYGEFINENFVKILENFASTSAPNNPIVGQIWFDLSENRLKVYDGRGFKIGSGPIVQGTAPLNPIQGDLWIDSKENQLYFYDGIDRQLAGPIYKDSQGLSGFEISTINDISGNQRVITKLWSAATLLGIFSHHAEFTPGVSIGGFSGTIKPGFNPANVDNFKLHTTAIRAESLVDSQGNLKTAENFMVTNGDNSTTGSIRIINPTPLRLGISQETEIAVSAGSFQIRSNQEGQDIRLITRSGGFWNDALTIKASNNRVGIFNPSPSEMLHIGTVSAPGNVIIEGNLTVNGSTVSINTENLSIEDKLIELAKTTSPSDTFANGGGISLKGTTDKTLTWTSANNGSWNSSEHFNLALGKSYRINNTDVLYENSLGTAVTSAPGLVSLGVLTSLQVDDIVINNNVISSTSGNNIVMTPNAGEVIVNGRISGLTNPINPQDAATRKFVEDRLIPPWKRIDSNYVANANERLIVDTSLNQVTVTLPSNKNLGDTLRFIDDKNTFDTNSLIILRSRVFNSFTGISSDSDPATYQDLETIFESGSGPLIRSGLRVTIQVTEIEAPYTTNNTAISVTSPGVNYQTGDLIRVLGSSIGGVDGIHDITFVLQMESIFGNQEDFEVVYPESAFGLVYVGGSQGWKYSEIFQVPPEIFVDVNGNLRGNVVSQNTGIPVLDTTDVNAVFTGTVNGNLVGSVNGSVTGNLTGTILTASQPNITSLGTLTSLTVSGNINGNTIGTHTGSVIGQLTGNVVGPSGLTLESTNNAINIISRSQGLRISAFSNTGNQEQYAMQVTPGTNPSARNTTILFGDVVVSNQTTSNTNGSSFRLPHYTIAERDARSMTFLNNGEIIYNSDIAKIQAYVNGSWVDLH